MITLQTGDDAPSFSGTDQQGNFISSADFPGQKVALYFYPKDDTPGCTAQACSLRDDYRALQEAGVQVIGVSPDDLQSHQSFSTKYNLPFPILADPEKEIIERYGVWGEKNLYGKKSMGILRTTFLIDEEGKIQKVFKRPQTKIHGEEILKAVSL